MMPWAISVSSVLGIAKQNGGDTTSSVVVCVRKRINNISSSYILTPSVQRYIILCCSYMVLRFCLLWLVDVWVTLCLFTQALLDYMSQVLCCRRCFFSPCSSIDFSLSWLSATAMLLIQTVLSMILPQFFFFAKNMSGIQLTGSTFCVP